MQAPSLLGFELQLDHVRIWKDADGTEYLGWPKVDAEAILEVFEKRIPLLLAINKNCLALQDLNTERDKIQEATKAALGERGEAWRSDAEAWKEAAHEMKPTWYERFFTDWRLWFILGAVGGAGLTKLVLSR